MRILITGAAGNLGTFCVRHLSSTPHRLRLLVHRTPLAAGIADLPSVETSRADLDDPSTLAAACDGVDCIVHLAGVLFAPKPEEFLPRTNVGYVRNLLQAALAAGVRRFVLVSFPHAEGETTPEHPATDRLDAESPVIHFRTRLAAERALLDSAAGTGTVPVVVRAGVVYGRGIKLTEGARRLLRYRALAIWRKPTWVHLIALPDFLLALQAAIEKPAVHGIYNVCDDQPLLLQDFLDTLAGHWGYGRSWRLPAWMFHAAGATCELAASVVHSAAPLTRDIVRAGMTSAVADTSRMKRELLPVLAYPTLKDGIALL